MSKTDKTAPKWVQASWEPSFLEEVHDHRFHDCNLPPRPAHARDLQWYGKDDRPCFWWISHAFWNSRWGKCCCYMCSRYAYSADPNIVSRREAKRYCKDEWREEY